MGFSLKRIIRSSSILDGSGITAVEHNPASGGKKTLSVGPEFQKDPANDYVSGANYLAGAQLVPGTVLYFYNNDTVVNWVTFAKNANPSAPSSFATGIPLPPNQWTCLSMGSNNWVRTGSANVGCYKIVDTTTGQIVED